MQNESQKLDEKLDRMRILGHFTYWGCMVGFIVLAAFPAVGKSSFVLFGIKSIGFLIIGTVAIAAAFLVQKYGSDRFKRGVIVYIIFGIIVLVFGIFSSSRFFKDVAGGSETKVLTNVSITRSSSSGKYKSVKYTLNGLIDGQKFEFDVTRLTKAEREKITYIGSPLEIVIYPNSKVITEYKKYGEDNASNGSGNVVYGEIQKNPELITDSPIQYTPETWPGVKTEGEDIVASGLTFIDELIQNSNLPYELLTEADDFQNFSNTNRLYESSEDSAAYVGLYPLAEGKKKITKIVITGGDYDILGMKIGDDFSKIASLLINYNLSSAINSKELELYPCTGSLGAGIYSRGAVKLFFFMDTNQKIIEMRVIICDGDIMSLDYD